MEAVGVNALLYQAAIDLLHGVKYRVLPYESQPRAKPVVIERCQPYALVVQARLSG